MIFIYVFKETLVLRDYHLSKLIYRLNLSIIDIPTLLLIDYMYNYDGSNGSL